MNPNFADQLIAGAFSAPVDELLNKYNLNWEVEKATLSTPDGTQARHLALQRSDNREILGIMLPGYEPFQNREMAELMFQLAQKTSLEMATATIFNGGAKVAFQMKSEDLVGIGENHDTVRGYLTTINSHDGSTSLAFGSTGITISCMNTFYKAYKGLGNKFVHRSGMRLRLEDALKAVDAAQQQEQALYNHFRRLANIHATDADKLELVRELTEVDVVRMTPAEMQEKVSKQKLDQVDALLRSITRETSYKGDTMWGLFSGITHYTSHVKAGYKRENGLMENKIFGQSQGLDAKAFAFIDHLIN